MSNTSGKILVACGWESGHREQTGAPGLHHANFDVGTTARTGSYSAQFDGGEYAFVTLAAGAAVVDNIGTSVGFYVAARAGSPADLGLWDITNSGFTVYVTSAGKLALKAPGGSTVWTGTYTISNTTWYVLWIWCNKESTYYWTFDVRLYDNTGATLHDSTGGTTTPAPIAINTAPAGIGNTNSLYLGSGVNGMGVVGDQLFMDDLIVTSGGPAPIGPKIVGVVPTGDGADDDFSSTSGGAPDTTYDDVDEIPLGSSDGDNAFSNASSGSKLHQTYSHASVSDPASSGNILCINICFRMARDAVSGTALCQPRMHTSGGSVLLGRSVSSTSSTYVHNTNGVRETSQAGNGWTANTGSETSIDDVQFGVTRTNGFAHAKFAAVMMEVAWGANYTDDFARQTRGGYIL